MPNPPKKKESRGSSFALAGSIDVPSHYSYTCLQCGAASTARFDPDASALIYCAVCLRRNALALWADPCNGFSFYKSHRIAVRSIGVPA